MGRRGASFLLMGLEESLPDKGDRAVPCTPLEACIEGCQASLRTLSLLPLYRRED